MKDRIGIRGEIDPVELRKNRRLAIIIGTFAIIALISLVYAFVQQVAAEKTTELAFSQRILAEQAQMMANQNAEEARRQEAIANELRKALEACNNSKK